MISKLENPFVGNTNHVLLGISIWFFTENVCLRDMENSQRKLIGYFKFSSQILDIDPTLIEFHW